MPPPGEDACSTMLAQVPPMHALVFRGNFGSSHLVRHSAFACSTSIACMDVHFPRGGRFGQCTYCGYGIALEHWKKCPCRRASYCDNICQKRDWKLHRLQCSHRKWLPVVKLALCSFPRLVIDLILHFAMGQGACWIAASSRAG